MKFYAYACDTDTYHSLRVVPPASVEATYALRGAPLGARWTPLRVEYDRHGKEGNFPRLTGHAPVLDQAALNALRSLVAPHCETLSLAPSTPDMPPLSVLNVVSLDCLDRERATASYLPDGKPIFVSKYAFREDVLKDVPIFRIEALELSHCFVSEEFRAATQEHNLLGLRFKALDTA